MKKKNNNFFIGTILLICIIIPLFYFTLTSNKLNPFTKKNNLGINDTNMEKNKLVVENNLDIENNQNSLLSNEGEIKSSGISDVKVPSRFSIPFIFKSFNKHYFSYYQPSTVDNVQPEMPGTIQTPTNNVKPIPKKNTTRRISPNIVESPSSYPKDKATPNTRNTEQNYNYPKVNKVEPVPMESEAPIIPPTNDTKPIETTPLPIEPNTQLVEPPATDLPNTNITEAPIPKVTETTPTIEKPSSNVTQNEINSLGDVEQAIFNAVNVERAKAGLPLLSYNKTMEKYARIKSKDMGDKNYFSHEDLQGNLITVQMNKDGVKYKSWGENIASRSGSINISRLSDQFMTQWMNSAGHRANILSQDFQSIGVGLYQIGNEVFATQEFYK